MRPGDVGGAESAAQRHVDAMDDNQLGAELRNRVVVFAAHNPQDAMIVTAALDRWEKSDHANTFTSWWREQAQRDRMSFHSYLGWLLRDGGMPQDDVLAMLEATTLRQPRSWTIPIEVSTGFDIQLVQGGVFAESFAILGYRFSPTENGLIVGFTEESHPDALELELVLAFMSFYLAGLDTGPRALRLLKGRTSSASSTDVITMITGAPVQFMPELDVGFVGEAMSLIQRLPPGRSDLANRLLRTRHRAILDTSIESKVVTLWAFLEGYWAGDVQDTQRLVSKIELRQVRRALAFLGNRRHDQAVSAVERLKTTTPNERIAEEMAKLSCANRVDTLQRVREIHGLRSSFAHGNHVASDQTRQAHEHYGFMLRIVDELITNALRHLGIGFAPSDGRPSSPPKEQSGAD